MEETKNRFVVTGGRFNKNSSFVGIVSGGRGVLGECGGINNPIHYVRVKRFTRWIVENVETEARWTLIPVFRLDLIYLSGGSYAGTKPSKSDSIMIYATESPEKGHHIDGHDFCFSFFEQKLE